jgi:hypothetical protein
LSTFEYRMCAIPHKIGVITLGDGPQSVVSPFTNRNPVRLHGKPQMHRFGTLFDENDVVTFQKFASLPLK